MIEEEEKVPKVSVAVNKMAQTILLRVELVSFFVVTYAITLRVIPAGTVKSISLLRSYLLTNYPTVL
jgi:hypothetical protein